MLLSPDTLEVKDWYFTLGRTSFTQGGSSLHPSNKDFVLDGRMRAKVSDLRPFSLFFMVDRIDDEDIMASLSIKYTTVHAGVLITLPTKRKIACVYQEKPADGEMGNIGVPVMFNVKDIQKHEKLVVRSETELSKLEEKEAKRKQAEAKKAARAMTKPKKDAGGNED